MNKANKVLWNLAFWELAVIAIGLGVVSSSRNSDVWFRGLMRGELIGEAKNIISKNRKLRYTLAVANFILTAKVSVHFMYLFEKYLGERVTKVFEKLKKDANADFQNAKSIMDCLKAGFKSLTAEDFMKLMRDGIGALFLTSSMYHASKLGYAKSYIVASTAIDTFKVLSTSFKDPKLINALGNKKEEVDQGLLFKIFDELANFDFSKVRTLVDPVTVNTLKTVSGNKEQNEEGFFDTLKKIVTTPFTHAKNLASDIKLVATNIYKKPNITAGLKLFVTKVLTKVFVRVVQAILLTKDHIVIALIAERLTNLFFYVVMKKETAQCIANVVKQQKSKGGSS